MTSNGGFRGTVSFDYDENLSKVSYIHISGIFFNFPINSPFGDLVDHPPDFWNFLAFLVLIFNKLYLS